MRYGLIAGNGKFPLLVLEGARKAGAALSVVAIHEETDQEIERIAERVQWVGIGQLGKMINFLKSEGVEKAIMAGQVKHVQIFSRAVPDARMLKMLLKLPRRNTDSLIGAVAAELSSEGIELIDSTYFLQDYLPQVGTLTEREPDAREREDIEYGLEIVREVSRLDLGQTVVIRGKACVAIEAMEGTDATIRRAGELTQEHSDEQRANDSSVRVMPDEKDEDRVEKRRANQAGSKFVRGLSNLMRGRRVNLAGGRLTVVKLAKPTQDMRFDVPVIGVPTIEAMIESGATCLCISAGKTLMFDRDELLRLANENKIAIIAV
ncbi:MAG TPA: UDP-2,3-diacylglucosamine diphosphatase LpxI [Pyrinomonadaceae bacterium]|nr:UDP-2,3-diacylglucosamine diphosphatase LpxI [Pyrinomonadaceae bacterium]